MNDRNLGKNAEGLAMMQIGVGIAVGTLLSGITNALTGGEMTFGQGWFLLPAVAVLMATVGLGAAFRACAPRIKDSTDRGEQGGVVLCTVPTRAHESCYMRSGQPVKALSALSKSLFVRSEYGDLP